MRKSFVVIMTTGLVLSASNMAFAAGDISPETYSMPASGVTTAYFEQGVAVDSGGYTGSDTNATSVHPYGTWNSPYTTGIDGYNYNDPQAYVATSEQTATVGTHTITYATWPSGFSGAPGLASTSVPNVVFTSGPHGGYLTSTHKCRECHAVHRAAGKFKLTRADDRFMACDWCHGTGAGSGYNIQMDNDDEYSVEYNVGHTMGFGIESGKWKAPDDTYPAYTPNYYMGGFSCFDCHSPHANPQRLMGFDENGVAIPSIMEDPDGDGNPDDLTGVTYNIGNPGHDDYTWGGEGFAQPGDFVPALGVPLPKSKPYYLAGSWLLIENPDREISTSGESTTVASPIQTWSGAAFVSDEDTVAITAGVEIPDWVSQNLFEFDTDTAYPVNKIPTNWDSPIGSASMLDENFGSLNAAFPPASMDFGTSTRNPFCKSLILDEFCTDCHDGNAGLHTVQAPLFSEERALRDQTLVDGADGTDDFRGSYDLAYGHDTNSRH